jgi:hypothetical protein
MTSLDRLKSINKIGLVPRNENNSKLVSDDKIKVFFSEGFEGAIALFVDFDIVYNKIKKGEETLENIELYNSVINSNNLKEYLGEGVYLCFDKGNIINERNFENGCTDEIIIPSKLNVIGLKNVATGEMLFSRFDVIHYMMSKTQISDIRYYGAKYKNSPSFEEATSKIREKVKKYYEEHKKEIIFYNNGEYEIIEISLNDYIKNQM